MNGEEQKVRRVGITLGTMIGAFLLIVAVAALLLWLL
jgi:hypothetical protein